MCVCVCRWVGLIDPTNSRDKGLQGYLRMSVTVLGPGDKLYIPDDAAAAADAAASEAAASGAAGGSGDGKAGDGKADAGAGKAGLSGKATLSSMMATAKGKKKAAAQLAMKADGELADADEASFADSLVLLPPSLQRGRKWLVMQMYGADGLPAMDQDFLLGLFKAGIDAFAEVRFAGNAPARTQAITRKGRRNLKVEWNRELWIPFQTPSFTSRIEVAVYDYDFGKENDRVGACGWECAWGVAGGGCAHRPTRLRRHRGAEHAGHGARPPTTGMVAHLRRPRRRLHGQVQEPHEPVRGNRTPIARAALTPAHPAASPSRAAYAVSRPSPPTTAAGSSWRRVWKTRRSQRTRRRYTGAPHPDYQRSCIRPSRYTASERSSSRGTSCPPSAATSARSSASSRAT